MHAFQSVAYESNARHTMLSAFIALLYNDSFSPVQEVARQAQCRFTSSTAAAERESGSEVFLPAAKCLRYACLEQNTSHQQVAGKRSDTEEGIRNIGTMFVCLLFDDDMELEQCHRAAFYATTHCSPSIRQHKIHRNPLTPNPSPMPG